MIIMRLHYLLIKQGTMCHHVCKSAGGPFAQMREEQERKGTGDRDVVIIFCISG